jgi:chromosome segregation ATPase
MPADRNNQKKIQCWIPIELWDKMESLGYSSITSAVNDSFTKMVEHPNVSNEISHEIPVLKARLEEKSNQIEEFKLQISLLTDQMHTKDTQIEKQAFHVQSLIQENSRLNIKLLPESQEAKKRPWYKFW